MCRGPIGYQVGDGRRKISDSGSQKRRAHPILFGTLHVFYQVDGGWGVKTWMGLMGNCRGADFFNGNTMLTLRFFRVPKEMRHRSCA
jgi:hypothetical protein